MTQASISFSTSLRNARAQKIIDAINAGTGAGTAEFWSGPRPAAGAAITTQTQAGTLTFSEPAGSINTGVLTFATITEDSLVDNTCWCRFARIKDGDGAWVADMDVAETDGKMYNADGTLEGTNTNAPIKMPSAHVFAGGALRITSAQLTEGNT